MPAPRIAIPAILRVTFSFVCCRFGLNFEELTRDNYTFSQQIDAGYGVRTVLLSENSPGGAGALVGLSVIGY